MSSSGIYQAETYEIQKHIFAVRNELKTGWSEEIYHQALRQSLFEARIPAQSKPRRALVHHESEVHVFEPDLIVADKIILELKVLPRASDFAGEHVAQLIHYLKFFEMRLGILVNFAPAHVLTKRVIWDEPPVTVTEDLARVAPLLSTPDRLLVDSVRAGILALAEQYGLGYSDLIYRNLVAAELRHRQIPCLAGVEAPAHWGGKVIGRQATLHLLVANTLLLHVCALAERPASYEFAGMKTFLAALGLRFGLLVNFGYRQLQIYGVAAD